MFTPPGAQPWSMHLHPRGRIFVLGAGKGGAAMARSLDSIAGDRLAGGAVVVPAPLPESPARIRLLPGGHPLPTEESARSAAAVMDLARQAGPDDVVVVLLSGGGSALLAAPVTGVTLADKRQVTEQLLRCGAAISEINIVRKHLSAVKGGRLGALLARTPTLTLALSDVPGDDPATIASGPTVADPSTFSEALDVVLRLGMGDNLPERVKRHLQAGAHDEREETPKPADPALALQRFVVVASNRTALEAIAGAATQRGWRAHVVTDPVCGEVRNAARAYLDSVTPLLDAAHGPLCVISGGETTVTVRGGGQGGRNQEFALAVAAGLDGKEGVSLLSAGTDGVDGPTPSAGAFVDGSTMQRARSAGLSPEAFLDRNDSHHFFAHLGDLLTTGPTGTNVMDVQILLRG
jgi:hydroxypyruvate reductase